MIPNMQVVDAVVAVPVVSAAPVVVASTEDDADALADAVLVLPPLVLPPLVLPPLSPPLLSPPELAWALLSDRSVGAI
jgi:hypothetical protein